jgi:hypothetical protein
LETKTERIINRIMRSFFVSKLTFSGPVEVEA